ncbi:MAG: penicillin-binding protein 1C [Chloroflexi bacterium]|nr:penicillin-binding protein 1C [Chloroflexota bacterium]
MPKTRHRFIAWVLAAFALLLLGGALFALAILPLPTPDSWANHTLAPSNTLVDSRGRLLYEIVDPHAGLHRPVPLSEVPLFLRQAIIATEDASFYENPGVSLSAIVRALWLNLRSGQIVSGGSTITQQLARNLLLEYDERAQRNWQRKLREALLAYRLTRSLSKDEILALYLNETYFGNMAYGVEAAARSYFGKPVAQLDLAECALLAGLPQAPGLYNPHLDLRAAKERQATVLRLMVKAGYIDAQQADLALREPLRLASEPFSIEAPHFVMLVRSELERLLNAAQGATQPMAAGGLRVVTTLDLDLQHAAEDHVRRHLRRLNEPRPDEPAHNVRNAAVLVLDPHSGAVRAMVGSPDYFDTRINGAVNAVLALRQPGSSIKPLTYAAAFERGYSPATMILDVPSSFLTHDGQPYQPINYDYRFHGPVSLREALASSYNVAAVRLLERIGPEALTEMAHRLGITTWTGSDKHDLALTLGSGEVSLLQLTAAYGALANGGYRVHPWYIERIEDATGRILYQHSSPPPERVLEERVAYLITDILSDEVARAPTFGLGSPLELPFPAAVKTGTTTEWRDNWTLGYSSRWVVGVWVGNADNEPMKHVSGVSGAAPIWNAVMRSVHRQTPPAWPRPEGLREVEVCALSGLLPSAACPHRRVELFLAENAPAQVCSLHRLLTLDARTGRIASNDTPADARLMRTVTFWPSEALGWAIAEGLPLPPDVSQREGSAPVAHALANREGEGATWPLRLVRPAPNSRFALVSDIPTTYQQIEIAATSQVPLREFVLWLDGRPWHTWTSPPYNVLWPIAPGEHELQLQGLTTGGQHITGSPIHLFVYDARGQERTSP